MLLSLKDFRPVMILLAYNILLTFILILAIPYFTIKRLTQKGFGDEWIQRLGFLPSLSLKKPIWVHAASVGEVFCSIPLLRRIRKDFPKCQIVLTTMTRTGNETGKKYLPEANAILYLPLDHPWVLKRFLKRINPHLLLIAETELWPNLLRSCGKRGIPIVLFNGRISEKSLRGYLLFKPLFQNCLNYICLFLMQTEQDRSRIIEIGAPSEKTRVVGNLKFDQTLPTFSDEKLAEVRRLPLLQGKTILIAGSTHSGEEEVLIRLFKDLKKVDPLLILLLAPRHLDRLDEVEKILRRESISWMRRTLIEGIQDPSELCDVILLDTMGELMNLYSLGTLVFIGGTLFPVGGHNPLEPLFFKKCVLFGPYMFHFSEISRSLVHEGGAIQVKDEEELGLQLKRLLSDERMRREIGERGYQFLQRHQGTTERTFKEVLPFLPQI